MTELNREIANFVQMVGGGVFARSEGRDEGGLDASTPDA